MRSEAMASDEEALDALELTICCVALNDVTALQAPQENFVVQGGEEGSDVREV